MPQSVASAQCIISLKMVRILYWSIAWAKRDPLGYLSYHFTKMWWLTNCWEDSTLCLVPSKKRLQVNALLQDGKKVEKVSKFERGCFAFLSKIMMLLTRVVNAQVIDVQIHEEITVDDSELTATNVKVLDVKALLWKLSYYFIHLSKICIFTSDFQPYLIIQITQNEIKHNKDFHLICMEMFQRILIYGLTVTMLQNWTLFIQLISLWTYL